MRILLVTSRYPWPARRGDQLRACQMLELLAPEHEVTLVCPRPGEGQPLPPATAATAGCELVTYRPAPAALRWLHGGLALAAGQPLQSGLFQSPDLRHKLRQLAPRADLGLLQLVRLAGHRRDFGGTPVVVDLIDDLALNFARRAAVDRPWLRPALALEARLLRRAERRLAAGAAAMLLVCDRDREELARHLAAADRRRLLTVGLVAATAAAATVRAAGGPARAEPSAAGGAAAATLVFTGNLGYFVNADAICWWLREVWPGLVVRRPGVRLVVAGDRPDARVRRAIARAGARSPGRVSLLEAVPDLQRVLAGATAALAPMRCGSGVPIKILDAWAAGAPVVASPWAAAGTTAVAGEDLLLAATPQEWIEAVSRLCDDPAMRGRLAAGGRRRLLTDFSHQRVKDQLAAALAAAAAAAGASRNR